MDTITDSEKAVVQTYLANLLSTMFANGKASGAIRWAVAIACGHEATVNDASIGTMTNAAIALSMLAWSWIDHHRVAVKESAGKLKADILLYESVSARIRQQQIPPLTPSAPPTKSEIKSPANGGFSSPEALLWLCAAVACALYVCGCRTVTVNEVPGGGPVTVNVNQSYAPDISLDALTGLDTNAWKAVAQGAAAGATK